MESKKFLDFVKSATDEEIELYYKYDCNPQSWMDINIKNIEYAEDTDVEYTKNIPNKKVNIYDGASRLFSGFLNPKDYIEECINKYDNYEGASFKDFIVIRNDSPRKLFLDFPKYVDDSDINALIEGFAKFIHESFGLNNHFSRVSDSKTGDLCFIFHGVFVDSMKDQIAIVKKAMESEYIPDILKCLLLVHAKEPEEDYILKKSPFNEDDSKYANGAGYYLGSKSSIGRKIADCMRYFRDDSIPIITADTYNINIKFENHGTINIAGRDILTEAVSEIPPVEKFVNHIINEQPSWYVENAWVPNNIFVEEYPKITGKRLPGNQVYRLLGNKIFYGKDRITIKGKKITQYRLRKIEDITL